MAWRRSRAFIDADIPSTTETHFSQCRGPDVIQGCLRHQTRLTRYRDSALSSTITELGKLVEAIDDSNDGDPKPQIDQVAPRLCIRSFLSRPIGTCYPPQGSLHFSNGTVRNESFYDPRIARLAGLAQAPYLLPQGREAVMPPGSSCLTAIGRGSTLRQLAALEKTYGYVILRPSRTFTSNGSPLRLRLQIVVAPSPVRQARFQSTASTGGNDGQNKQPPPPPPRISPGRLLARLVGGSFRTLGNVFRPTSLRLLYRSNPEELVVALVMCVDSLLLFPPAILHQLAN